MPIRYLSGLSVDSTVLVVDAANDRVGIGTASPSERLTVVSSGAGVSAARFTDANRADIVLSFPSNGVASIDSYQGAGDGALAFRTAANERMRITSTGNVGIGTTSPQSKLQIGTTNFSIADRTSAVYGAAASETIFTVGISGVDYPQLLNFGVNQAGLYSTISARQFTVATENKLVLQPNGGNVGIGTTAPVGILHLYKAAAATRLAIDGDAGQNRLISYRTGALQRFGLYVNNTAESGSNAGSNFAIRAYSDAGTLLSTPFFINRATGNVGIGTTSPAYKLDVAGTGAFSGNVAINGTIIGTDQTFGNPYRTFAFGNNANGSNRIFAANDATDGLYLNAATGQGINFRVNGGGANVLVVASTGAATFSSSGLFSGNLQTNGVLTIGNQSVAGNYFLSITPSTTVPVALQGVLAGTGAAPISLQASGGNVLIGTTTDVGYKLQVNGTSILSGQLLISADAGNEQFIIRRASNNNEQLIFGFHSSDYGLIQAVEQLVGYRPISLNPNGGNILIGTTTDAGYKLDVSGTARVSDTLFINTTDNRGKLNIIGYDNGGINIIDRRTSSSNVLFYSSVTFRDYYDSVVAASIDFYHNQYFGAGVNRLGFSFEGSERLTILRGGNVGIGTTTPAYKLDVRSITTDPVAFFGFSQTASASNGLIKLNSGRIPQGGSDFSGESGIIFGHSGGTGGVNFDGQGGYIKSIRLNTYAASAQSDSALVFATSNDNVDAEQVRITNTGNVLIGTTTDSGFKLDVNGTGRVSGQFLQGSGAARSTNGTTVALTYNTVYSANSDIGDGGRFLSIVNESSVTNAYSALSFRVNPDNAGGGTNAMLDMKFVNANSSNASNLIWSFLSGGSWFDRMALTSGGNVGIGTTAPGAKLQIGDYSTSGGNTLAILNSSGNQVLRLADYSAYYGFDIVNDDAGYLHIIRHANSVAGTSALTIKRDTGDVGIGTTAPASILHVSSTGANAYSSTITKGSNLKGIINTLSNNGDDMVGIYFGTGTDAAGSHWSGITGSRSNSAVNWGTQLNFYTHNDDLSNITDATQKMVIKDSGNVGIGTTAPANKLEVDGGSSAVALRVSTTNTGVGVASLILSNSSKSAFNDGVKITHGAGYTNVTDLAGTSVMVWDMSNTRVGIGTTSPSAPLTVAGGTHLAWTAATSRLTIDRSGTVARIQNYDNGSVANVSLQWEGGNVGIGTTGPTEKLHVDGSTLITYNNSFQSTNSVGNKAILARVSPTSGIINYAEYATATNLNGFVIGSDDARVKGNITGDSLEFITNTSTRMTILSGGNVGINTTTPGSTLHVIGDVLIQTGALGVGVNPNATDGRIDASNDIVAFSTSDRRLKENITPIANALEKVRSLTGVEFDWKEETKSVHGYEGHDVGVIAQDVQAVLPEAVRTNDSGYLSVRYEKMIALLVEANKELADRVEQLEKLIK